MRSGWRYILYDGHVVVCFRDSGVGIAPDVLPHIFDLFVRADDMAVRSRSGLGIGLALVRMLVNLHGGNVTAASEGPGTGQRIYGSAADGPLARARY